MYLFLNFNEGREDPKYHYKRAILGPPVKRHLNDFSLECRYWPYIKMSLGSFVIFQGSGPVAKETIFCDILEGVLWTPPPPPRIWIRAWRECRVRPDIIMSGLI